jgi:hypothetical protein
LSQLQHFSWKSFTWLKRIFCETKFWMMNKITLVPEAGMKPETF